MKKKKEEEEERLKLESERDAVVGYLERGGRRDGNAAAEGDSPPPTQREIGSKRPPDLR